MSIDYNEMKCLMISYDIENGGSRNQGCSCLYKLKYSYVFAICLHVEILYAVTLGRAVSLLLI